MNRLPNEVRKVEDYGGTKSPSFKSFATKFKNDMRKEVEKKGGIITMFNVGHYYVSGFFRTSTNQCYYFSISDVRHFPFGQMLYRTAKDERDFTGGVNQYIQIATNMIYQMNIK